MQHFLYMQSEVWWPSGNRSRTRYAAAASGNPILMPPPPVLDLTAAGCATATVPSSPPSQDSNLSPAVPATSARASRGALWGKFVAAVWGKASSPTGACAAFQYLPPPTPSA